MIAKRKKIEALDLIRFGLRLFCSYVWRINKKMIMVMTHPPSGTPHRLK